MKIIGIYLAAGKSTRMGRNKLELPFKKDFLGSSAFRAALESKLDVTFVVTRKANFPCFLSSFLKRKGWSYQYCEEDNNGLSDSLKTGVKKAVEWGADAIVVLLADQPFVTTECINRLLKEFTSAPKLLFVSASQKGDCKPPVLISKEGFPALMKLTGDMGAKGLLQGAWKERGKGVEFENQIFTDVDTFDDYVANFDQIRSDRIGSDW